MLCRSFHLPLGSTKCRRFSQRFLSRTVEVISLYISKQGHSKYRHVCSSYCNVIPTNLFTKVYITATHHYLTKGICCHSIEFRQLRSSLMKLFQQFERWNLKLPIANGANNIRQHSCIILCRQTAALISFNTTALDTNLAHRTLRINYCIAIKNYNCILQTGTQNE